MNQEYEKLSPYSHITSFCARVYGKRRGKVKSDEIKSSLGED